MKNKITINTEQKKEKSSNRAIYVALIIIIVVTVFSVVMVFTYKNSKSSKRVDNNEIGEKQIEWKKAYRTLLEENEQEIKNYNWQNNDNNDLPETGAIALCDIDENGIPELFFMASDGLDVAEFNIYTYIDGKAEKLFYEVQGHNEVPDCFRDVYVASGTTYLIYKCKEKGHFNIYHGFGDAYYDYMMEEYNFDGENIERTNYLLDAIDYEPPETEHWYINNSEVSENEFLSLWRQTKYDMDTDNIIMYSRSDSDVSHYQLVKNNGSIAMDYDEAINKLSE